MSHPPRSARPRLAAVRTLAPLALLAGCGGSPGTPDGGQGADSGPLDTRPRIYVSTNRDDFSVGQLASITLDDLTAQPALAQLSGDAVLGWHGSFLVALNFSANGSNNVTYFDARTAPPVFAGQVAMVRDGEVGMANPRGYLALDDRRAYVTRNALATLAVVDRVAGAITSVIDLSPFRAGATLPNPRRIARVGAYAWVSLERWSGVPLDQRNVLGAIALIDPASDAVVDADPSMPGTQAIELPRANPAGRLVAHGDELWVACPGAYQSLEDGAVLAIQSAPPYAVREVLSEHDAGGNLDAAVPLGDDRVLARVVAREDGVGGMIASTRLVAFSLATRTAVATFLETPGYRITEPIVARDGRVYVGQRGSEDDPGAPEGVWVFTAAGERVNSAPIAVGLRPYELSERSE